MKIQVVLSRSGRKKKKQKKPKKISSSLLLFLNVRTSTQCAPLVWRTSKQTDQNPIWDLLFFFCDACDRRPWERVRDWDWDWEKPDQWSWGGCTLTLLWELGCWYEGKDDADGGVGHESGKWPSYCDCEGSSCKGKRCETQLIDTTGSLCALTDWTLSDR